MAKLSCHSTRRSIQEYRKFQSTIACPIFHGDHYTNGLVHLESKKWPNLQSQVQPSVEDTKRAFKSEFALIFLLAKEVVFHS